MITIYCLCFVSSSTGPLSAQAQAPFKGKSKEWLKIANEQRGISFLSEVYYFLSNSIEILNGIFLYTLTFFCAVVQHRWSVFPPPAQLYLRGRLDTNYAFMLTVVESLSLSCLWQIMHWCHWVIESLSILKFLSLPLFLWMPFFNCLKNKFITINPQQQDAGVFNTGCFFNWAYPLDWPPPKMLRLAPPP